MLAGRQWLLFVASISKGVPKSKVTGLGSMNQPLLIIKLVIRPLMRSSKHLLSLHIHEIIRPLREAHQAMTALHHGCVLQTSIVLMVVLRLQVGPCLVLKVRAKYF